MVKKIKFEINFSNRWLYTLVAIGILLTIGVGVYAYGTSNPSNFGHSAEELEIDLSSGVDGNAIFNDNVGIGTTNPQQKLHVNGNLLVQGDIIVDKIEIGSNFILSEKSGSPGLSCDEVCGTDTCLAAYYLYRGWVKTNCDQTSSDPYCLCVGIPFP